MGSYEIFYKKKKIDGVGYQIQSYVQKECENLNEESEEKYFDIEYVGTILIKNNGELYLDFCDIGQIFVFKYECCIEKYIEEDHFINMMFERAYSEFFIKKPL